MANSRIVLIDNVWRIGRIAGNIGGNYIVRFREKISGFLLAELNIAN